MSATEKKSNSRRRALGSWGEQQAEAYLLAHGLEIVERNYRIREGEVDIIAREKGELIFAEVKTRSNVGQGYPEEAVTDEKIDHLTSAAEFYLQEHPEYQSWRMDVIAVVGRPGKPPSDIEWFKNVS